jgi:2-polyprenyl-6-methoxyphenol hydroxylase-like FAD-dependent oxidoreductase
VAPLRAVIAGGGIGGLAAALSLHAAGIEARVFEASREIRPLGVGINLLPHAVRELTELGLGEALASAGVPTAELVYHDRFGSRIWAEQRGIAAGYRWPQYSIHRGALLMLLLAAVHERLGPHAVVTGREVRGFEQEPGEVLVRMRDRGTGREMAVPADVLVGADGIHSAVRAELHPDEGPPIWNGIRMWRGIARSKPFLSGRTMIMAGSNRRVKFVAYPISPEPDEHGDVAINWVAEVRLGSGAVDPGDWNRQGRADEVLAHLAAWRFDWLDVPALVAAAPVVYEYPMVDRDPLPRWGAGRVTLLGDAAHPMYPIGSNGASQAILDARVLAFELARSGDGDVVSALAAYEETRRPPTSALVLSNRDMGPERVMAIVEERAPDGFRSIEDVMTPQELQEIADRYKSTAGFDVETLNARPSWTPRSLPSSRSKAV